MATEIIGKHPTNYWVYEPDTGLCDLTRPKESTTKTTVTIKTDTNPIRIDPAKSALIIVDMQNFFLSPELLGLSPNDPPSKGVQAANVFLSTAIPAARKLGIRVVWLNWGLTDEDVATMPPAVMKAFGVYEALPTKGTRPRSLFKTLGGDLGPLKLQDGTTVEVGRTLVRDTWNAALYSPLEAEYFKGKADASSGVPPDVWIHKNRPSGLWGSGTGFDVFLQREGLTTLFFGGVNTDQCVGGTLTDAFSRGYDCILLRDAAATTSPIFATQAWEWNCAHLWGYATSSDALMDAVVGG